MRRKKADPVEGEQMNAKTGLDLLVPEFFYLLSIFIYRNKTLS
jgi:hypothetical protein